MAGLGNATTTLLTTRGLFIDDGITSALEFGAGVTPWFKLWIGTAPPPPVYQAGSNGGSRPLLPGQIQQLYKPVDPSLQYYVVPRDQEAQFFSRNKVFQIELIFKDHVYMKQIEINDQRARTIFKVINFVNATRDRISVVAEGFKAVPTKAKVKVTNFRLRRKKHK